MKQTSFFFYIFIYQFNASPGKQMSHNFPKIPDWRYDVTTNYVRDKHTHTHTHIYIYIYIYIYILFFFFSIPVYISLYALVLYIYMYVCVRGALQRSRGICQIYYLLCSCILNGVRILPVCSNIVNTVHVYRKPSRFYCGVN